MRFREDKRLRWIYASRVLAVLGAIALLLLLSASGFLSNPSP
jgi:hypothetical protein